MSTITTSSLRSSLVAMLTPPDLIEAITSLSISPSAVLRFSRKVLDVAIAIIFASISIRDIVRFVNHSKLFYYVKDKNGAINRLVTVSRKTFTANKLERIASMTMRDPLFKDPDFEDLIVLARITNRIDDYQLGTFFYWKSVMRRYGERPLREVPLFLLNGSVNPEAKKIMQETTSAVLTDAGIEEWFQQMKGMPPSEQRLLMGEMIFDGAPIVNDYCQGMFNRNLNNYERLQLYKAAIQGQEGSRPTIMDAVYVTGLNLFNRVGGNRMFPSMRMADVLFRMKGGHCRLAFRFGVGPTLRENGLYGERDIALRNSYQLAPVRADGIFAPFDEYTSHDLNFHAYLVNLMPREHQRLFIEIGDLFARESEKPHADPMMWYFADRYYDMECPPYLGRKDRLTEAFLLNLYETLTIAVHRKLLAELQKIYANKDMLDTQKDELALQVFENAVPYDDSVALRKMIDHFASKKNRTPLEEAALLELNKLLFLSIP